MNKALKILLENNNEYSESTGSAGGKLKEIKRILVPVDFSDYSKNACQYALKLAEMLHAEIELLYSYYSPDIQTVPYDEPYIFHGTLADHMQDLREKAKKDIENYVNELRDQIKTEKIRSVMIDYSLMSGSISDVILDACETYQPNMIVIGMRGHNTRKNDFIGSSALKILEKAKVPVLAVPENSKFDDQKRIRRVIYATDFDESDFTAITKLMGLVAPFDMKIYCVHIGITDSSDKWEKVKMNGLKEYFRSAYPGFKVECKIINKEDVIQGLDNLVIDNKIDIVSLTTHKRSLISKLLYPSMTRKLFFHTNIPLLVFHSQVE
jgi:nucleotide-binding universal stress UspA family protein